MANPLEARVAALEAQVAALQALPHQDNTAQLADHETRITANEAKASPEDFVKAILFEIRTTGPEWNNEAETAEAALVTEGVPVVVPVPTVSDFIKKIAEIVEAEMESGGPPLDLALELNIFFTALQDVEINGTASWQQVNRALDRITTLESV